MSGKLPISLVVITHNEEKNLSRCLTATDFCAEIIVVDSGSTDRTLDIAAQFGAKIFHRAWTGYRDQKNFGSEQATQEWILCVDADEVVTPELCTSIAAAFAAPPVSDAFEINRHAFYAGKAIGHCGWYPQWRLFLYRKGAAVWGGDEPHTVVEFRGHTKRRLAGDLNHYTYDSIRQHMAKNLASAHAAAQDMHSRGLRTGWFDLLLRGPWAFLRTYIFQLGFLDGFYGLVISSLAGVFTFLKYAMLWEMTHGGSSPTVKADDSRNA